MPIGLIFEGPGVTQAQYDQVRKQIHPDNARPPGMLFHAAGPGESGWRVIEVWDSQAAATSYFQETLAPAMQQANIPATVRPQVFPVHNMLRAEHTS